MAIKNIITDQNINPEKIHRARGLRSKMTPAEKILWQELRTNKLGSHFRRQQVIAGFKEAERTLNLEEEQRKMTGVIHGLRSSKELDEAPGAYKDIDVVMENQRDLVNISVKLIPFAVIKG